MLKYKIEGYSEVSTDDALAQAMAKAGGFASEGHDLHVAILELVVLPGRGYKAVVEVTIVPITLRETLHRESQDEELKRISVEHYRADRKREDLMKRAMVSDHFLRVYGTSPDIPDVFLAQLDDSQLKNFLIEKQFNKMFQQPAQWQPITDATVLAAMYTVLQPQAHHHVQPHHHVAYEGVTDHTLTIDNPALEKKVEADFDHAVHPEHRKPEAPAPAEGPAQKRAPGAKGARHTPGEEEEF
jgi:hypothetical protein